MTEKSNYGRYTGGLKNLLLCQELGGVCIIIYIGLSIICPRCCVITIGRATKAGARLYPYGSPSFSFFVLELEALAIYVVWAQTSFFIKKHSAMPPPRGPQNTKYLLALISSFSFFCVTVCENKKKRRKPYPFDDVF